MFKAYIMPALAGAFLLGLATAAWAVKGEFGNMCAMSLAAGKDTQTDGPVNAQRQGKTYCFSSSSAWPGTFTLRQMPRITPFSSMRKVERSMPIYFLPYMLFSTQVP